MILLSLFFHVMEPYLRAVFPLVTKSFIAKIKGDLLYLC